MAYIEGLVAAVPTASKEAYRNLAAQPASILRRHDPMPCDGKRMIFGRFVPIVDSKKG